MTTVTAGGTPAFMAPELLCPTKFNKSSARPTQPADIYAFGMVIYEVLTGLQPFHEKKWNEYELVYNVMTGARPTKPADAEKIGFGNGTWELVEECWIAESTRRPTIDQILTHLTSVAAHSKAVDPTPAKPCEAVVGSAMSDSSSKLSISLSHDDSHPDAQVNHEYFFPNQILPTVLPRIVQQARLAYGVRPVPLSRPRAALRLSQAASRNTTAPNVKQPLFLLSTIHCTLQLTSENSSQIANHQVTISTLSFDRRATHQS